MLELGTQAPDFSLLDARDGAPKSLDDMGASRALLVMFICNHCPYVVHLQAEFAGLSDRFSSQGLNIVAINSNSIITHPQDGPEHMKSLAEQLDWEFPYLFDESQAVAQAYRAACTPDFFLFDESRRLVYRGQFDDSRPGNDRPITGNDLNGAIEATLRGEKPNPVQRPSMGCNIKWAAGVEPDYF
jgi:peroxiredoxin